MFSILLSSNQPTAVRYAQEKVLSNKWLWYIWLIFAAGMFILEASTIDVLPSLMQDEAQITDYGRLVLDPVSSWSVTWSVAADKPLHLWSYLGPLFAEFGYQIGGPSGVGPRFIALLGGLTAAIMALGWLLARKVPSLIAGLLSLAFLLDPLFTLSQRMARSDSWVMTFCLASCWLLVLSSSKRGLSKVLLVMLSGILAATASFVWPSAVFLYPLIFLELFCSVYDNSDIKKSLKQVLVYSLFFCLGGVVISIALIIPISGHLGLIMGDMKSMVALNVEATKTWSERLLTLFGYQPWAKLIKAFVKTLSPGLPLMALWALLFRREKGMVLTSVFTLSIIFMTLVYEFRLLYLIPYCLAITGDLFLRLHLNRRKSAVKRISRALLVTVVIWALGISIFLRSALAFNDRSLHDRSLISEAATSAIGKGNYKVFLAFAYEFYFAGRSLGWQLYTPYIQFTYDSEGNWIRKDDYQPKDKFNKLMTKMDYAIFPIGKMNKEIGKQLQLSGLTYKDTVHISDELVGKGNASASGRMHGIILWFLRGADSYGPYLVYARSKANGKSIKQNTKWTIK
jgi:hypothetical protein